MKKYLTKSCKRHEKKAKKSLERKRLNKEIRFLTKELKLGKHAGVARAYRFSPHLKDYMSGAMKKALDRFYNYQ